MAGGYREGAGRPSTYTDEIAQRIEDALADGKTYREVALMDGMPDRTTIYRWQAANPDFATRCARARADNLHDVVDDMDEIARKTLSGEYDPAAARVALSNMQWRAEKMAPKLYGGILKMEVTGKDGGPVEVVTLDASGMSDSTLAELMAARVKPADKAE